MIEKITLPSISYKNYKATDGETETLELHDDYLRNYGVNTILCSGEDDLVPVEKTFDFDFIFYKKEIILLERYYSHSDEAWKINISTSGGHKLEVYMKSKSAAVALLERLHLWKQSKTSLE